MSTCNCNGGEGCVVCVGRARRDTSPATPSAGERPKCLRCGKTVPKARRHYSDYCTKRCLVGGEGAAIDLMARLQWSLNKGKRRAASSQGATPTGELPNG